MELTRADAGGVRRAHVGDDVTLVLDENPTTGYRWFVDVDETMLRPTGDENDAAAPRGASGLRRLTFAALRSGTCSIHAVLRRSWEHSGVDSFDVDVEIV